MEPLIIYVAHINYEWACNKWPNRDVRIDTYLPKYLGYVVKPGWFNKPRKGLKRYIRIKRIDNNY